MKGYNAWQGGIYFLIAHEQGHAGDQMYQANRDAVASYRQEHPEDTGLINYANSSQFLSVERQANDRTQAVLSTFHIQANVGWAKGGFTPAAIGISSNSIQGDGSSEDAADKAIPADDRHAAGYLAAAMFDDHAASAGWIVA